MRYVLHENHYLITDVKRRLIGKKFILFIKNYFKIKTGMITSKIASVKDVRAFFFFGGGEAGVKWREQCISFIKGCLRVLGPMASQIGGKMIVEESRIYFFQENNSTSRRLQLPEKNSKQIDGLIKQIFIDAENIYNSIFVSAGNLPQTTAQTYA